MAVKQATLEFRKGAEHFKVIVDNLIVAVLTKETIETAYKIIERTKNG